MKTDNQKTQVVILAVLVIFVLAYGAYRIIGPSTQAASPTKKSDKKVELAKTDQTPNSEAAVAGFPSLGSSEKAMDPFAPRSMPKSEDTPASTVALKPLAGVRPIPNFQNVPLIRQNVPPIGIRMIDKPQEDPRSVLTLCGVVEGRNQNVAIIKGQGNSRYIVKEGQVIDGKYLVKTISRVGVWVRYDGRTVMLNISSPSKAPGSPSQSTGTVSLGQPS